MISQEEYDTAKAEPLVFQKEQALQENAKVQSWFVDQVIQDVPQRPARAKGLHQELCQNLLYKGGLKIYATVDIDIQNIMDEVFEDMSSFPTLKGDIQPEASMVVLDPYTGAIKGLTGGRGKKTGALLLNMATQTKRQPGSTIKAALCVCAGP